MKFNDFLTEATGKVWVVYIEDVKGDKPFDVLEQISVYTNEQNLVKVLIDQANYQKLAIDFEKVTTVKQFEMKLVKFAKISKKNDDVVNMFDETVLYVEKKLS